MLRTALLLASVAAVAAAAPTPAPAPAPSARAAAPAPAAATNAQLNMTTALADVPFLNLEDLYAPPVATDPKLSPDGEWLAYLAPEPATSALNVYATRVDKAGVAAMARGERPDPAAKRPPPLRITNATKTDISPGQYQWNSDSKSILVLFDPKGGDRYRIYSVPIHATNGTVGPPRDLVPLASSPRPAKRGDAGKPEPLLPQGLATGAVNVGEFFLSERVPGGALVTLDDRAPGLFDVYRLNTSTGALTLDTRNPGDVGAWIPDKWLRVRGARAMRKDGGGALRVRTVRGGFDNDTLVDPPPDDGPTSDWRNVTEWRADDTFLPVSSPGHAFAFTDAGTALYVLTSVGADFVRLVKVPTNGSTPWPVLASSPDADIVDTAFDATDGSLVAVATDAARRAWLPLNAFATTNAARLKAAFNGSQDYAVASSAGGISILKLTSDVAPPTYYLFDVASGVVTRQVSEAPALASAPLVPTAVVTPVARDGLPLPSYLNLPPLAPGWNASGARVPLVVLTRATPWTRDAWGWNPTAQALANRGYAVLRVNFRGSGGFGRAFSKAGVDAWGRGMTTDLIDAAAWAVDAGVADPARVSFVGFDYGGYASLDAATSNATAAAVTGCAASVNGAVAVDSVAPLQPPGFARLPPPPRASPEGKRDAAAARAISPLHNVDRLAAPTFQAVAGGGGRVKDVKQFNADARKRGVRTELYLYPGAAGLATDEARVDLQSRLNLFLSTCGGGRAAVPLDVAGVKVDTVSGPAVVPRETRRVDMAGRPTPYAQS